MNETLTKLTHDSGFLVDGLRDALNKASNIESIIILNLIRDAAQLNQKIQALNIAHNADKGEN